MSDMTNKLLQEVGFFVEQMQARYTLAMLTKIYGTPDEYLTTVTAGLLRNGTSGEDLESVRVWLKSGLRPFIEYPPTVEALIQLANLVRAFPITPYTISMQTVWYRLDTEYGQRYGNLWKGASEFDPLHRERVWLKKFEEENATPAEIGRIVERITLSTIFRIYPPALEQFMDALLAVRHMDSPLIEEAWLVALSSQPGSDIHPLVRTARGVIGAFEINTSSSKNRGIEQRFKMVYRDLLLNRTPVEIEVAKPVEQYMDRGSILNFLSKNH